MMSFGHYKAQQKEMALPNRYAEINMSSEDYVEVKGIVVTSLPNAMFKVKLANDKEIICHISGKIRKNAINIITGDIVTVAISAYDMTKGRIVFREKGAAK